MKKIKESFELFNMFLCLQIMEAIPSFLAIVAAGVLFRVLGWWV